MYLMISLPIACQSWPFQNGVMLSSVEAWWAGLCALPFDGAQGDTLLLNTINVSP
jgi:hypothetical protein